MKDLIRETFRTKETRIVDVNELESKVAFYKFLAIFFILLFLACWFLGIFLLGKERGRADIYRAAFSLACKQSNRYRMLHLQNIEDVNIKNLFADVAPLDCEAMLRAAG